MTARRALRGTPESPEVRDFPIVSVLYPKEETQMTKKDVNGDVTTSQGASRRKFLKAGAVGAAGAATLGFPMVSRAQTTTLKMQGSWGAKDIFN